MTTTDVTFTVPEQRSAADSAPPSHLGAETAPPQGAEPPGDAATRTALAWHYVVLGAAFEARSAAARLVREVGDRSAGTA
jgi:hypothetical protein